MATFAEVMQNYVNSDYEDLVLIAQKALISVLPACKAVDPENEGIFMATSIILSAIAADGKLTAREKQFITDTIGLDDDTIAKMISLYDSGMADLVDKFADSLSSDVKTDTMTLVICVAACDETISREETAFISKLLN